MNTKTSFHDFNKNVKKTTSLKKPLLRMCLQIIAVKKYKIRDYSMNISFSIIHKKCHFIQKKKKLLIA